MVGVPVSTLHISGGNLIPGELHTDEAARSCSGSLRNDEENRKTNLPGLDLRHLIMEMMLTSFMEMNLM